MVFIWLGLLLLALAVLFALPFFGVGMIIPIVGDLIDIPISFIFAIVGIVFLFIGGLLYYITKYWWAILILIIVYLVIIFYKGKKVFRRRKR